MELTTIRLPSTQGATIAVTAKTFSHMARQAEDHAYNMREEAKAGGGHPRVIIETYQKVLADLDAVRKATAAEVAALDAAINILSGGNEPASQHPAIMTAREIAFRASAFSAASSEIVRSKSAALVSDSITQLRASRDYVERALGENDHRLEAIRNKSADAFRAAVAGYSGPYGFSLKSAAELLGIPGIPKDEIVLPAPDYNPRLPGDHPARLAAVLQTVCKSKEAEAAMMREHLAAKKRKSERKPTKAEIIANELAELGDR